LKSLLTTLMMIQMTLSLKREKQGMIPILQDSKGNQTSQVPQILTRTSKMTTQPMTVTTSKMYLPREDVCQSRVEIVTPYWATNSNDKVRAILNNDQFGQAIHQEICTYVLPM
jgi:hypothetical protein